MIGTTRHLPCKATDHKYDESRNVRPSWVDDLPDPDQELARYLKG